MPRKHPEKIFRSTWCGAELTRRASAREQAVDRLLGECDLSEFLTGRVRDVALRGNVDRLRHLVLLRDDDGRVVHALIEPDTFDLHRARETGLTAETLFEVLSRYGAQLQEE